MTAPQHIASRFPKFIQTDIAVGIDAGYIPTGLKAFSFLNPKPQCVEDPSDFTWRKAQNHLKIRVAIFLHAMSMRIAGIGQESFFLLPALVTGAVCYKMDDPVDIVVHTAPHTF